MKGIFDSAGLDDATSDFAMVCPSTQSRFARHRARFAFEAATGSLLTPRSGWRHQDGLTMRKLTASSFFLFPALAHPGVVSAQAEFSH